MREELVLWLQHIATQAKQQMLLRALDFLLIQHGTVVEDALQRILASIKDMEEDKALDYIEDNIHAYLINALKVYGVTIDPESVTGDIEPLTDILETLQNIEHYEDLHAAYVALNNGEASRETLCQLVSVYIANDGHRYYTLIERVSDTLIANLRKLFDQKVDAFEEEVSLLDNEEKLKNKEALRQKREELFAYLEKITNGNPDQIRALKTLAGRFATYRVEEIIDKCYNTLQRDPSLSIAKQANMWAMVLHLMEFIDVSNDVKDKDRHRELRDRLTQLYTDQNFLFSLTTRLEMVLEHGQN